MNSRSARHGRRSRYGQVARPAAVLVAGAACLLTTSATPLHGDLVSAVAAHHQVPAKPAEPAKIAPEPQVIPQPASMTAGRGWFRVGASTPNSAGAAAVAA